MDGIQDIEQLEDLLSAPSEGVIASLAKLDGDLLILGVGGKMGPSLARMAKRASDGAGTRRNIIGAARFSSPEVKTALQAQGIGTIRCDLLDQEQLNRLPDVPNVVYMAGMKFGATGNEALTWAMNAFLPGIVSQKFAQSRIAAFSTGNVYGVTPVSGGGSCEDAPLNPQGDYAMSCLGRERIFEHFCRARDIPMSLIRLNYACEMRYGVLADIARKVWTGQPVDVTMGYANVIWQGDANAWSLQSLAEASVPPCVLNVAGPEQIRVRDVAQEFGRLLDKPAVISGEEAPDALLSCSKRAQALFGPPRVGVEQLMAWCADWIRRGGSSLDKPTHFEVRDGKF